MSWHQDQFVSTLPSKGGGSQKMIHMTDRARQPHREPWPVSKLQHFCTMAINASLDPATWDVYSSFHNLWIYFCEIYNFDVEPTLDTLSYYTVFMSYHIDPCSVGKYLTGICNELEMYYPNVQELWNHKLIKWTLCGCLKLFHKCSVQCKLPLTPNQLSSTFHCHVIHRFSWTFATWGHDHAW